MSNNATDILTTVLDKLRDFAKSETIVGEPVHIDNITILPVIRVSVGFAAGSGEGNNSNEKSGNSGNGGGGGGGAVVSPVGFIVYDGEKVQFVGTSKGKIDSLFDTIPEVLNKLGLTKKNKGASKSETEEKDA